MRDVVSHAQPSNVPPPAMTPKWPAAPADESALRPARRSMKEAIKLKQSLRYSERGRRIHQQISAGKSVTTESDSTQSEISASSPNSRSSNNNYDEDDEFEQQMKQNSRTAPDPPGGAKETDERPPHLPTPPSSGRLRRDRLMRLQGAESEDSEIQAIVGGAVPASPIRPENVARTIKAYEEIRKQMEDADPATDDHLAARRLFEEDSKPHEMKVKKQHEGSPRSKEPQHQEEKEEKGDKRIQASRRRRTKGTATTKVKGHGSRKVNTGQKPKKSSQWFDDEEGPGRSSTIDHVLDFIAPPDDLDDLDDLSSGSEFTDDAGGSGIWNIFPEGNKPKKGKKGHPSYPGIVPELQQMFLEQLGCVEEFHVVDEEDDFDSAVQARKGAKKPASSKLRYPQQKYDEDDGTAPTQKSLLNVSTYSEDEKDAEDDTTTDLRVVVSFDQREEGREEGTSQKEETKGTGGYTLFQEAANILLDFLCAEVDKGGASDERKKSKKKRPHTDASDPDANLDLTSDTASYISGMLKSVAESLPNEKTLADTRAHAETFLPTGEDLDFCKAQASTLLPDRQDLLSAHLNCQKQLDTACQKPTDMDCQKPIDMDRQKQGEADELVSPGAHWPSQQDIKAIITCSKGQDATWINETGEKATTVNDTVSTGIYSSPVILGSADASPAPTVVVGPTAEEPPSLGAVDGQGGPEESQVKAMDSTGNSSTPEHFTMDKEPAILVDAFAEELESMGSSHSASKKTADVSVADMKDSPGGDDNTTAVTPEISNAAEEGSTVVMSNTEALNDFNAEIDAKFFSEDTAEIEVGKAKQASALDAQDSLIVPSLPSSRHERVQDHIGRVEEHSESSKKKAGVFRRLIRTFRHGKKSGQQSKTLRAKSGILPPDDDAITSTPILLQFSMLDDTDDKKLTEDQEQGEAQLMNPLSSEVSGSLETENPSLVKSYMEKRQVWHSRNDHPTGKSTPEDDGLIKRMDDLDFLVTMEAETPSRSTNPSKPQVSKSLVNRRRRHTVVSDESGKDSSPPTPQKSNIKKVNNLGTPDTNVSASTWESPMTKNEGTGQASWYKNFAEWDNQADIDGGRSPAKSDVMLPMEATTGDTEGNLSRQEPQSNQLPESESRQQQPVRKSSEFESPLSLDEQQLPVNPFWGKQFSEWESAGADDISKSDIHPIPAC